MAEGLGVGFAVVGLAARRVGVAEGLGAGVAEGLGAGVAEGLGMTEAEGLGAW